jgi:predicted nucleic acid-binding protein
MTQDELQVKGLPELITGSVSKKKIESIAADHVKEQMEEGMLDPLKEIVSATKLSAYFAQRVSSLRPYALTAVSGSKEVAVLGAKVVESRDAGSWSFSDPYIDELEAELKIAKEKAKLDNQKDRMHITLAGEEITITKGVKKEGGENVKVML